VIEFQEFEKISRLNREVIVTEKIDGTNGQVHIRPAAGDALEMGYDTQIEVNGESHYIRAGSRNRWVLHLGSDDNNGFGRWVHAHAHELAALGAGAHFGEWWGLGIQRKYGVAEKRWSLFNVARWNRVTAPACCHIVPILQEGIGFAPVYAAIDLLKSQGSLAAPGFMKPEGVVAFHTHSRTLFKMTIERDQEHKWESSASAKEGQ
jgi:RNA ligase